MRKAYVIPNDGNVHHYTDTGGLIGIIESEHLWATNIQFLNDSLEYDSGLLRIASNLRQAVERINRPDSKIPFTTELKDSVESSIRILEGIGVRAKEQQFICCFSRYRDDLSQWRGYAREGYCITFDEASLTKSVRESQPDERSVRHGNVSYGDAYDWAYGMNVDAVLAGMHDILHNNDKGADEYGVSADDPNFGAMVRENNRSGLASLLCVTRFQDSIPFLKEDGFSDEQEMRIGVSHPKEIKFRASTIGPMPYCELRFDPKSIKAITVGPGLNIELRTATLEYLLAQKFGSDHNIEVKKTELSFRG
ncbi:DUF2971 domain-containing protein [Rhodococcus hoagii]|nr:DUF2971 domain-containing protein [Prescottella equi]MBM4665612.1 DUF2971 domain-containing protein [Prescottella equi]NKV87159.1 DUF2971 domain-containing protein [Prescottella equi]